jgi:hypothetical protein
MHELRKRAKDLWHAAQVLRPTSPGRMKRLARRGHALSDLLGDDHDLAVLLDAARERHRTLRRGELALLRALIGRRRARLQRAALACGRRVYGPKPAGLDAPHLEGRRRARLTSAARDPMHAALRRRAPEPPRVRLVSEANPR